MNREIKFRGLRKVGKQMIVGDLAKLMHEDNLCIMPDSFYGTRDFDNVDNNGNPKIEDYLAIGGFYPVIKGTVGQFTGLKDKNGKDIYEGDIVGCKNWETSNYHIEFIEGAFCLTNQKLGIPTDVTFLEDSTGKHFEVIGNIHENPELIQL